MKVLFFLGAPSKEHGVSQESASLFLLMICCPQTLFIIGNFQDSDRQGAGPSCLDYARSAAPKCNAFSLESANTNGKE